MKQAHYDVAPAPGPPGITDVTPPATLTSILHSIFGVGDPMANAPMAPAQRFVPGTRWNEHRSLPWDWLIGISTEAFQPRVNYDQQQPIIPTIGGQYGDIIIPDPTLQILTYDR